MIDPPALTADDIPDTSRAALIVASILFAALSTWMSFTSHGFLEADGVTHYMYARFAFESPFYFVDVWARPVRMLIHAIPAHFGGLHGVRAASLTCAIGCAWLTYAIARKLEWTNPGLAGFFVLAQPLVFLHSFSELTELPFALLAAGSFLALLGRRWWLFAILCGLMPAARPEGGAFIVLAVIMLIVYRRWHFLPMVFLPILAWNHIGWVMWGSDRGVWWRWLIDRFPYSSASLYPAGPIWRFLAVLPTVVSPLILPAVLLGTGGLVGDRGDADAGRSRLSRGIIQREVWLIAAIPWGILSFHSLLYWSGRMSSSGEPRYLLAAAPFWALLACRGWTMCTRRFKWRAPIQLACVAAILPCFTNIIWRVVPLEPQPDAVLCEKLATWYRTSSLPSAYPNVYASHPLIYYSLDVKLQDVTSNLALHPPAGAMYVYDSMYASFNSDPRRKVTPQMFEQGGWHEIPMPYAGLPTQTWKIFLSPQPAPH